MNILYFVQQRAPNTFTRTNFVKQKEKKENFPSIEVNFCCGRDELTNISGVKRRV